MQPLKRTGTAPTFCGQHDVTANPKLVQRAASQELDGVQAAKELHDAGRQQADMAAAETQARAEQREPCEDRITAVSADAPSLQAAKPELRLPQSAGEHVGGQDHREGPDRRFSAKPEREVQHAEPQAHHQQEVRPVRQ